MPRIDPEQALVFLEKELAAIPGYSHVAKLMESKDFREGWARAQEQLRKLGQEWPQIQVAIEEQRKRLSAAGFPTEGDWIEYLLHICRIIEKDPDGLTAPDIEDWAMAWIDREIIRRKLAGQPADNRLPIVPNVSPDPTIDIDKPKWDAESNTLTFGAVKLCNVAPRATNLRKILDGFETSQWASRIDDPISRSADPQRLGDAVSALNQKQETIRFSKDGTGRGVCWESVKQEKSTERL